MTRTGTGTGTGTGTTTADLTRVGLGPRALDPVTPPGHWRQLGTSAHSVMKASRAVLVVEHLATRLGLPHKEAERLRPVLYVMACAVYDWDAAAEAGSAEAEEELSVQRLRAVVAEVVGPVDGFPDDLDGLDRLASAERAALEGRLGAVDAFSEVSRWRSCDLRLMLWVVARLHGWSPALVDALRPLLELFEVDDDLGSVAEDERHGSYNSWVLLRTELSHEEASDFLRAWARTRAEVLVAALDALPRTEAARVRSLLLYPFDAGRPFSIALLDRTPRPVLRRVHQLLVARLGAFYDDRLSALRASATAHPAVAHAVS